MSLLEPFYEFVKTVRERGVEYTSGRYYTKYQGEATTVVDPQEQGRVRVTSQYVTGRTEELRQWAYPTTPYGGQDKGFYFPPDEGDPVWVWFDLGKPDQPRISGSWWCNPSPTRTPATSHVPAEFRGTGVGPPTRRGIKWKRGHVLLGEDDPKAAKIRLQTGEQTTPGEEATVHHSLLMDDTPGQEQVVISSFGGHQSSWVDIAGQEKIEHKSAGEHVIRIDDVQQNIVLEMLGGYRIVIDQKEQKITAETPGQQKIELTDTPPAITLEDATQQSIKMEPTGITVDTPFMTKINALGLVDVTAATTATVKALGGLVSLIGQGVTVNSTGGGVTTNVASGATDGTFTGAVFNRYLGAFTQTVIGVWKTTAATAQIFATAFVELGSEGGSKFFLVDERFLIQYNANIDIFNAHSHAMLGAPPSAAQIKPVAATVTTQTTKAN